MVGPHTGEAMAQLWFERMLYADLVESGESIPGDGTIPQEEDLDPEEKKP